MNRIILETNNLKKSFNHVDGKITLFENLDPGSFEFDNSELYIKSLNLDPVYIPGSITLAIILPLKLLFMAFIKLSLLSLFIQDSFIFEKFDFL